MRKNNVVLAKKGLNDIDFKAISELESICNKHDNSKLRLNWDMLKERSKNEANDFLYFVDDKLIGYLGMYILNRSEAEVSGMVHPEYRRKGIFSSLVSAANKECMNRKIPKFLFFCENTSETGAQFLESIGAKYKISEYEMKLDDKKFNKIDKSTLKFRKAEAEDTDLRIKILSACFDYEPKDKVAFTKLLQDKNRLIYVAEVEDEIIGNISASKNDGKSYIYGVGILPEYRGKGYGKQMLSLIVEKIMEEPYSEITLEVACNNENALTLYKKCGFEVVTSYDYYELFINNNKNLGGN